MPTSEKDPLAAEAKGRWEDFREGFPPKSGTTPSSSFNPATKRYAELMKSDSLVQECCRGAEKSHRTGGEDSKITAELKDGRTVVGRLGHLTEETREALADWVEQMKRNSSAPNQRIPFVRDYLR